MVIRVTAENERTQEGIIQFLEKKWQCRIFAFPSIVSNIDYVAARDEPGKKYPQVSAFIEIKRYSGTLDFAERVGIVWLDDHKVQAFKAAFEVLKVPSIYVVSYDDGLVYLKWETTTSKYLQMHVGRKDRGDPNDVKLAHRVPFSDYKVIKYESAIHANRKSA
jgi:hypothetical protein